ncbi:MAG: ABC transporter ATP-binding protein, partial [Deltaproteobacteria bacterium]
QEYVGGYDDWLRQRTEQDVPLPTAPREQKRKKGRIPREKQKLSYKETRELEALPLKIEALEQEKQHLLETLNSPAFYVNRDAEEIKRANDRLKALEEELEGDYGRWEELESLAEKFRELGRAAH